MDDDERHRFVQQYVERQKAYLPTYTAEHLLDEHLATLSKPLLRSDEFGFDTPVLRPRVPVNRPLASQPAPQAGPSKSRTRGVESRLVANQGQPPTSPEEAPSRPQGPHPGKKDKQGSKRKKATTPIDTDSEHAARLADRRERKKKKRAIVNPSQKDDPPAAGSKKGSQKVKKPAALALLYGFSATNVTKDRLTLKPPPSFGVFGKGKASAKKKVTATKNVSSRNEIFSESAFLNKPSERTADRPKTDDDLENGSVSSISNHSIPQGSHVCTKRDRRKCTKTPVPRTSQGSIHKTPESEVWDIELQSKLPSSARDVSSEPGDKDSAPIVLDLRGTGWSAPANVSQERDNKTHLSIIRSRTRGHSAVHSSPLAVSPGLPDAADNVPSIHPSHSASQIGHRAVDVRPAISKYFTEPEPVAIQEYAADPNPAQTRSNDGVDALDSQILGPDVQDTIIDVQTNFRVVSPMNSLVSAAQPIVEFRTRYDVAPLEFPSDGSPCDDWYARVDVPWEVPGGSDGGYSESCAAETRDERWVRAPEHEHPCQGATWNWYRSRTPSVGVVGGYLQHSDDPLAREHEDEYELQPACFPDGQAEYDEGQGYSGQDVDFPEFEETFAEYYSNESLRDGEDVTGFLQGRALLLGVPGDGEWPRSTGPGLSGLDQAEIDVASRLRGHHWRPLRL